MSEWYKTEFADHELEYLEFCDLCGSPGSQAKPLFTKLGLPVVQCSKCELIYVNPRLRQDILWQRYSQEVFLNEYLPQYGEYDEQLNYRLHAPRLRELGLYASSPGRLLDIGCAIGLFLAAARLDGWEVMGNELQPLAATYALEQFDIPVVAGNFETLDLASGSFDALTMWDTIEHVQSPRAALIKAAKLIRPGGILALSTPNVAGISFHLLRDRWWLVEPKEHIFYFTPKTMTHLLDQTGFEVKKLWTATMDFYYLYNTLRGREVMPWHIRVAEGQAETPFSNSGRRPETWAKAIWSRWKPQILDVVRHILRQTKWADSIIVYAVRKP
jgi:2-polyprenyl-3-methyl-5-hydroxy-6-metoxy-1,4-benzoquinol methylase